MFFSNRAKNVKSLRTSLEVAGSGSVRGPGEVKNNNNNNNKEHPTLKGLFFRTRKKNNNNKKRRYKDNATTYTHRYFVTRASFREMYGFIISHHKRASNCGM